VYTLISRLQENHRPRAFELVHIGQSRHRIRFGRRVRQYDGNVPYKIGAADFCYGRQKERACGGRLTRETVMFGVGVPYNNGSLHIYIERYIYHLWRTKTNVFFGPSNGRPWSSNDVLTRTIAATDFRGGKCRTNETPNREGS